MIGKNKETFEIVLSEDYRKDTYKYTGMMGNSETADDEIRAYYRNKVKEMKKYQRMYDAIYVRINEMIMKELLEKGTDTNSYLPKEWLDKDSPNTNNTGMGMMEQIENHTPKKLSKKEFKELMNRPSPPLVIHTGYENIKAWEEAIKNLIKKDE